MGCGICGFVGLSDRALLQSMCDVMKYRGPDETGLFLDKGVGLGVDRLRVIDLVKGDQPIHNEDGSIWVAFNGEIYNHRELRDDLERRGHRFYTDSDTETILHAYEVWGVGCLGRLRGMFAFALWDGPLRRLFLARDRFGKKPLFYALVDGVLLFASEIKSILQYEQLPRRPDRDALDLFLSFGYVPSPLTAFEGVKQLPGGCYATFSRGRLTVRRYWDMPFEPDPSLTEEAALDALHRSIEEAVKLRLESDVPLGAFLSGGIDSSTVVAVMSRLAKRPVKTVSVGFEEDGGQSELPYAKAVADLLGTDHEEHVVKPDAHRLLPLLVWHFDQPCADHSMIPTYHLSQVARRSVTVALSGDGGDEMFMGYPFLSDPSSFRVYSRVPRSLRRPAIRAIRSLPVDARVKRAADHAYEKDYGGQPYGERFAARVSQYDRAGLKRLYSGEALRAHAPMDVHGYMAGVARSLKSEDELASVDYATIRTYLQDDILVKVDRMSMASSLEVRCPLLDQELAELVGRIPTSMKLRRGTTKYLLKKMVVKKGLLPAEVANRRKHGFGAPMEAWMRTKEWREALGQAMDPLLTGRSRLFDPEVVKKLMADPYLNSNKLFALMVFSLWQETYLGEAVPRGPAGTN